MTADCRHGFTACPNASGCACSQPQAAEACTELGADTGPATPGALARAWRWVCRWLHDAPERHALRCRMASLQSLEESLRDHVEQLSAKRFLGTLDEQSERLEEARRCGRKLDETRQELERIDRRLQELEQ